MAGPFKIVGIDDDGLLPERAMNALDSRYSGSTYYARNHGITSGTNITQALLSLIDSIPDGSTIKFEQGASYTIDPFTFTKPLIFDGSGSTFVGDSETSEGTKPLIQALGSVGEPIDVSTVELMSSHVSVAYPGEVGDWVLVGDMSPLLTWNTATQYGIGRQYITRVLDKTGTAVTLADTSPWELSVSPYITPVDLLDGVVLRNFTITDTNPGSPYVGPGGFDGGQANSIALRYTKNALVEKVNVDGWRAVGVHIFESYGALVRDTTFDNPFFIDEGGNGHCIRFIRSVESLASNVRAKTLTRHLVNYVQAVRCGSENSYGVGGGQFQSHGWQSVGLWSVDDTVDSGESLGAGWQVGNRPFGYDTDFQIVRPRYTGTGSALLVRTASKHVRVTSPHFESPIDSALIRITEGANDTVIDWTEGHLRTNGRYISVSPSYGAGSLDVGNVRISAGGTGGSGNYYLQASGDIRLSGIDPANIEYISGSGLSTIDLRTPLADMQVRGYRGEPIISDVGPWHQANQGFWCRVNTPGTIRYITLHVLASSGNISVGLYRGSGVRDSAVPVSRVATSGSVTCPAVGIQNVSIGGRQAVEVGDWLFLSCDNNVAKFAGFPGMDTDLAAGTSYRSLAAHPAPSIIPSLISSTLKMPALNGGF